MSWGWKVALLYLSFVAGILTLVFKAHGEKVDLVASDYYKQEIAFGDRMQAMNNYQTLSSEIKMRELESAVLIELPAECIGNVETGTVTFYRPSDSSGDRTNAMNIDMEGYQSIPTTGMQKGLYVVKIEWTMKGSVYFMEQTFTLS